MQWSKKSFWASGIHSAINKRKAQKFEEALEV